MSGRFAIGFRRGLMVCVAIGLALPLRAMAGDSILKDVTLEPEPADSPNALVREIVILQERIALGDRKAHRQVSTRLPHLAAKLMTAPEDVWSERRNRLAAVKLVAVGGPPNLLRHIYLDRDFPAEERKLAAGVMFNAMGRRNLAQAQLAAIDHRTLPPSLAGTIALIKGLAESTKSVATAFPLLDEARLLSPGTIVEETALRITIQLAAKEGDNARATKAFFRYVRRFGQSVYFQTVIASASRVLAGAKSLSSAEGQAALASALQRLDPPLRIRVLETMAVAALRVGALEAARFAGSSALNSELDLGARRPLFEVHLAAAELLIGSFDENRTKLETLRTAHMLELPRRERSLADASLALATAVRAPPVKLETADRERLTASMPTVDDRVFRDLSERFRQQIATDAASADAYVKKQNNRLNEIIEQTKD